MKSILGIFLFILTVSEAVAYTDIFKKSDYNYHISVQQTGSFLADKNYYIEAKILPSTLNDTEIQNRLNKGFLIGNRVYASAGHLFYSDLLEISEEESRASVLNWYLKVRPQFITAHQSNRQNALICLILKRDRWSSNEVALAYDCLPYDMAFEEVYFLDLDSKNSLELRISI